MEVFFLVMLLKAHSSLLHLSSLIKCSIGLIWFPLLLFLSSFLLTHHHTPPSLSLSLMVSTPSLFLLPTVSSLYSLSLFLLRVSTVSLFLLSNALSLSSLYSLFLLPTVLSLSLSSLHCPLSFFSLTVLFHILISP